MQNRQFGWLEYWTLEKSCHIWSTFGSNYTLLRLPHILCLKKKEIRWDYYEMHTFSYFQKCLEKFHYMNLNFCISNLTMLPSICSAYSMRLSMSTNGKSWIYAISYCRSRGWFGLRRNKFREVQSDLTNRIVNLAGLRFKCKKTYWRK